MTDADYTLLNFFFSTFLDSSFEEVSLASPEGLHKKAVDLTGCHYSILMSHLINDVSLVFIFLLIE